MLKIGLIDEAGPGLAGLLAELGATVVGPVPADAAGPDVGLTREQVEGSDAIVIQRVPPAAVAGSAAVLPLVLLAGVPGAGFDVSSQEAADVCIDTSVAADELGRAVSQVWSDRLVPFEANLRDGRRAPRRRQPVLSGSDPTWPVQARRLIARLVAAADGRILRVDHIGSTSVAGLPAKDLIDIQMVVADLDNAVEVAEAVRVAGFVRAGRWTGLDQYGVEHPEEVVVDADPGRPVNINIRAVDAPVWRQALLFRDWLRATPPERMEYAALKRGLAADGTHVDDYSRDKMPWIHAALTRAARWAQRSGWQP
ncbi:dephospho-CoA kinase [Cryptosporangium aurantiacum]|uniref:GrpB domain, predicted nucleotidyltransferase, UPF0157 family n=1 Tax=Cryptosporangium aurantiacum TaxID=134849 RepID=A0A1M7R1K0_9ACTN|nr:dephospho-CoA kinase [Cryptosporangium aurantiacum]SHN38735.1 GrpB domain, predicted nucleotidyltransferase, UPF0157 family [Cryptosporangium aurantiacum]